MDRAHRLTDGHRYSADHLGLGSGRRGNSAAAVILEAARPIFFSPLALWLPAGTASAAVLAAASGGFARIALTAIAALLGLLATLHFVSLLWNLLYAAVDRRWG